MPQPVLISHKPTLRLVHVDDVPNLQLIKEGHSIVVVEVNATVRGHLWASLMERNTVVGEVHRKWHRSVIEFSGDFIFNLAINVENTLGGLMAYASAGDWHRTIRDLAILLEP